VVVVAAHYWQARTALAALPIEWIGGEHAAHDTDEQRERYQTLLETDAGRTYDKLGDSAAALARAENTIEARYHAPYLAHATLEPINCTTLIRSDDSGEVWMGNQAPTIIRWATGKAAGIPSENIVVHTPYLGGGFGRRGEIDVAIQAAVVASRMRDTPIQIIWSREEDMQHDLYRPMGGARFRASLASDGTLDALDAKSVGQSCVESLTARLLPIMASEQMKYRTVAEGIFDFPYAIPHRRVAHVRTHEPIPVGFWRSVGHSHNAFFAESFIDECAVAANADPYAFRRAMLGEKPRHRAVLDAVAKAAGWDTAPPQNVGRGIALVESYRSIVAQVAEVELEGSTVKVKRVVCAVDCGFAINPDNVVAQMESGIIFGLTAALYGEITVKHGRVQQSNFPDYGMVTLANAPDIEVHIIESGIEHLGGVGEPGTPPIAPAVCNALYALSGKRIRELPIRV
jgi:isoquinoline 1-oxidoreductase beta subunit